MYVLAHKGRVIVGPMGWNRAMFDGALKKLKIEKQLSRYAPTELPMVVNEDTSFYEAEYQYPEYNPKIEYIHGPFWDFTSGKAIGTFQVKETPVDLIKSTLIEQVAAARYNKEVAGTTLNIQDTTVTIDTNRGSRDIFVQKYLLMADDETVNWKFPEGWLTLSKTDLGNVVSAGTAYVQGCFDWEKDKVEEINACTTASELDAVVIVETE